MKNKLAILFAVLIFLLVKAQAQNNVNLSIESDYNGWGWEALVVDNGLIEIVIIPEIGGRVMYYGFPDDEYMAVNNSMMGHSFDPATNPSGPWSGTWGYGGFKNWPSPQDWGWPPPPVLDWGPYSYVVEHNNASDSVVIYLESEVEIKLTPGLKQARRFTIYKNSTLVKMEQYLTNTVSQSMNVGIWDITQAVVQHGSERDYENFSVYFPATTSNTNFMWGSEFSITEVEPGLQKFVYTSMEGKYGMYLYDGWCSFVDERDAQTYVKLFNLVDGASYPDDNSNFELYSSGGSNYIEIEVMGPLENIGKDDQIRLDEYWYAAKVDGPTLQVNSLGVVAERAAFNSSTSKVKGEYGLFVSGSLIVTGYNASNEVIYTSSEMEFDGGDRVNVSFTVDNPGEIEKFEIVVYDADKSLMGVIDSWLKSGSGTASMLSLAGGFNVYPTVCKTGETITLNFSRELKGQVNVTLTSLNGKKVAVFNNLDITPGMARIQVPSVLKGLYIVGVQQGNLKAYNKIVVQ